MNFAPLAIEGLYEVIAQRRGDSRGWLMRLNCADSYAHESLNTNWTQINQTYTATCGTLRGMHFQRPPHAEVKLVRCIRGKVWDVAVDLRAGSPSYGRWVGLELSAERSNALYIPEGFAHGFQSLSHDVEMIYLHSTDYAPAAEGGVHYACPDLAIDWPLEIKLVSDRDAALPFLPELEPLAP